MRSPLKLLAVWVGLVAASAWAIAQTPPAGFVQTQVTFLVVGGAPELKDGFINSLRQRVHVRLPVSAGATGKSAPVAYEGPASLALYAGPVPAQPAAGQPPPAPSPLLARVELPKAPQVLVLLGPGPVSATPGAPTTYSAIAVADDWVTFPAGTARVLNYSGKRLQVSMAGHTFANDAGPGRPLRVTVPNKPESEFQIQLTSAEPDGPFLAYDTSIKVRGNQRLTVVVVPRSREGGRGVNVVLTREVSPAGTTSGAVPQPRPNANQRPPANGQAPVAR